MSNKLYDTLKWVAIIFLPAISAFLGTVLTSLNVANTEVILIIINAFATFLGTLLGISNINYKKGVK